MPPCVNLFVFHGMCSLLIDRLTAADKRHMSKTHWKGKLEIALLDVTWTFELVTVFVLLHWRQGDGRPKKEEFLGAPSRYTNNAHVGFV